MEGRCGSVRFGRPTSRDCRAGVDLPDAVVEGCRLKLPGPPAAAARSAEACDMLADGALVALAPCVEVFAVPLAVAGTDGVFVVLLVLSELDDLCLREGVGCVAPVSWCAGFGSEISTGRSEAEVEFEECEAFEATEAVWARSDVSSRVRRLTCTSVVSREGVPKSVVMLTTASCSFSHSKYSSAAVKGRGCLNGTPACSLLEITGLRCEGAAI